MLSWEMRSYEMASTEPGAVFFDRCIPELPGYLRLIGLPVPDHMKKAAENYRYSRGVFIFPPWPEIFTQDAERKQTLEEAERTFDAVAKAYRDCGYDLIEVPRVAVEERLRFVLTAAKLA